MEGGISTSEPCLLFLAPILTALFRVSGFGLGFIGLYGLRGPGFSLLLRKNFCTYNEWKNLAPPQIPHITGMTVLQGPEVVKDARSLTLDPKP